ncbi:MAG: hypothetical protein HY956_07160 [Deltaproteobacteria bacterium]|nr:hypothetical protein [Deltaproteobacteria bacterium]
MGLDDLWSKALKKQLLGEVTDEFLETLLKGMDIMFFLSNDYRENIEGFHGKYVFKTADDTVKVSAIFDDGDLTVLEDEISDWDARITFASPKALWSFLFSKNQDILDSLLKNEVEVDGNLNYIYKFGFLAKDIIKRLHLA